jgi:hypothetical protein
MKKFCDLNWVLQEINAFKEAYNQDITKSYLSRIISNTYLGGRVTNIPCLYDLLINKMKLCKINDFDCVIVTKRGQSLLQMNKYRSYDLNDDQKLLLSSWYISSHRDTCARLFQYFSYSENNYCCKYTAIPLDLRQFVQELLYLAVFTQKEEFIYIKPQYWWLLVCDNNILGQDELMDILEKQKEAGEKAEKIVFEVEIERLKQKGWTKAASKVSIISKTQVNAGYDIISFSNQEKLHDRFIEVKCIDESFTFYWTEHEMRIASMLRDLYFLYLFQDINADVKIWVVQNPIERMKSLGLVCNPMQYKCWINKPNTLNLSYEDIPLINLIYL